MTLEIVVKKGPSKGLVMPLDGRRSVTIGRAPSNALVLKDDKVSSHHARLDLAAGGVILTDLGSKNGTFAAGQSVIGSRLLPAGMEVAMGGTLLELRAAAIDRPLTTITHLEDPPTEPMLLPGADPLRDVVLQPATHPSQRNLTKAQRNLAVLAEVGDLLSTERDPNRFLTRVMDLIFDVLPADRGCLLMMDDDGNARPRVARLSEKALREEIQVSRTILSKVLGGASILTADAGTDERLSAGESIIAQNIRSAMCVPIRGRRKSLGAIYVDTVLSTGVFGKDDLEMLSTVGVLTGTALENIELFHQNLQHERMAAIGKVVASLGHDIRNMLTALRGGMYLLNDSLESHADEDVQRAWQVVRHGHESIASLVQDMVGYSKPREPEWQLCDLNSVARAAVEFARDSAREKGVGIAELFDPKLGPVYMDPQGVERCVLNLLSNAIDAAPTEAGMVSVATERDEERRTVRIVVHDNGEGIPSEHRDKVFDLLFSTKGSRGTGFGLAITKKLVEEHGGRVYFRSDFGRGTTFTLELPLRETPPGGNGNGNGNGHG